MPNCYQCFYRSRRTLTCDYTLIEGVVRWGPASECDKFKPRKVNNIAPYELKLEEMYYQGKSDRDIARTLNISRYTVYAWRAARGLEPIGNKLKGRPKKEESTE